jgi:tRNA (mo5U34)-methyltransferase
LLEWGASRVTGLDIRAENIRRAVLVRDHFDVPADQLELRQEDLFDIDPEALGRFDVVLLLGLIYHVEDPVGALRRARALTRGICAIDTQLTRHDEPIAHTWGVADSLEHDAASFAARLEWDAEINPVASSGGAVSLIPNRAAVELSARAAGFSRIEWPPPQPHHDAQYRNGDRAVVLAYP